MKPMGDQLRRLMEDGGHAETMLLALVERAKEGDLKAVQLVLALLGEDPGNERDPVYRLDLGPGVEELCE